jgi:two-component system, OmpR family, KDP operon response regulator KdpE
MVEAVTRQASWPQAALFGHALVLVIDGDAGRRRYIGRILRAAGCTATVCTDPTAAQPAPIESRCDALLLSLDPPQEDWIARMRACRAVRPVPMLVLLENAGPEAVARMLDAGADDCLAIPFDAADLSARLARLLRVVWRRRGMAPLDRVADMQLDLARPRVRMNGRDMPLTKLEYRTLWVLAQGEGAVLSFRDIELRAWGDSGKSHHRALRRVIRNLRRKLGSGPSGDVRLLAEPRVGYRLCLTVRSASP